MLPPQKGAVLWAGRSRQAYQQGVVFWVKRAEDRES